MRNISEIPDKELRSSQISQPKPPYNIQSFKFNFQPAGCRPISCFKLQPSDQKMIKAQASYTNRPIPIPNQQSLVIGQWAWALGNSYEEGAIWRQNFRIIENNIKEILYLF